jgi:hypothetical protein
MRSAAGEDDEDRLRDILGQVMIAASGSARDAEDEIEMAFGQMLQRFG